MSLLKNRIICDLIDKEYKAKSLLRKLADAMSDENKVRSWERLNDSILLKKTDKSIFRYGGATIPQSMHSFFGAASMVNEERREIQIRYDGCLYQAHLKKEALYLGRVRIFWSNELKEVFAEMMKDEVIDDADYPMLIISKISDSMYEFFLR